MIIKSARIEKFRALQNVNFELGSKLTAIVGQNGTMKTTVLGILSQTFTISKGDPLFGEKTIDGYNFKSQFKEKFKVSDKDVPGEHKWRLGLYPGIYKREYFEAQSMPRQKDEPIRFWSTEGRTAGTGYPQVPAYYLSLKRLSPIGEENDIDYISELTPDEIVFLELEYKDIMSITDQAPLDVHSLMSSDKHTVSIHDIDHDAFAISAGQDNIGKLLIAILSFKRLKDKYKDEYKGGILLIDEIESTLHSLAQTRLIKRLYRYSSDYKIQFIFTTHSPSIIKATFFDNYNTKEAKLVYLKKEGNFVTSKNIYDIKDVILELSGSVKGIDPISQKITLYTEDDVALSFVKSLLYSGLKNHISFSPCSIGAESYIELARVKLKPIIDSIIILDGDKNTTAVTNKLKRNFAKNFIFLPSFYCPEEMFYRFLFNLPDTDPFWDNNLAGYDKKKCFANHPTLISRSVKPDKYKEWFKEQSIYWGRGNSKLYNYWKINNADEYNNFINNYIVCYNMIAPKHGLPELDTME